MTSGSDNDHAARVRSEHLHRPVTNGHEVVYAAEQLHRLPVLEPWEIRTIARRIQHASDSMGVQVTLAFADRMAVEGLCRTGEVGMTKTADTVIYFVESKGTGTVTVLGWADHQSCLDRFGSLRLLPNPAAPEIVDTTLVDDGGPEL